MAKSVFIQDTVLLHYLFNLLETEELDVNVVFLFKSSFVKAFNEIQKNLKIYPKMYISFSSDLTNIKSDEIKYINNRFVRVMKSNKFEEKFNALPEQVRKALKEAEIVFPLRKKK